MRAPQIISVRPLDATVATAASLDMHVCPCCKRPVLAKQRVRAEGNDGCLYHARCWDRRVLQ